MASNVGVHIITRGNRVHVLFRQSDNASLEDGELLFELGVFFPHFLGLISLQDTLESDLARVGPQVGLVPHANLDEEMAKLDARAEQTAELEHPVPVPEPAEHRTFESNLLSPIGHEDAEERRLWFSSDAMNGFPEGGVHPVAFARELDLPAGIWLQRQHLTDGTEASNGMKRKRKCGRAGISMVWGDCHPAQFRVILVASLSAPVKARPLFSPLGKVVEGEDLNTDPMQRLAR